MKQYVLLVFLAILITACAPKIEVEEAQQVEEPIEEFEEIIEEVAEELEEPEEISLEENTIEITESSFSPKEKTIEKNTEIKWVKKDKRDYKIVCYLGGTRVIESPNLKEGESFIYNFPKDGEYTCITIPYGLRNIITVKEEQALLSPTGGVVLSGSKSIKRASLAAILSVMIGIFLFFVYARKPPITEN